MKVLYDTKRHSRGPSFTLGPLETKVMQILWNSEECGVSQVQRRLSGDRKYTTVMTTMVRLYRKGVLKRREHGRCYLYSARVSAEQWASMAAAECVNNFLATWSLSRRLLLQYLAQALAEQEPSLRETLGDQSCDIAPKAQTNHSGSK